MTGSARYGNVKRSRWFSMLAMGCASLLIVGCETGPIGKNTAGGAGIGALVGGAGGYLLGGKVNGISKTEGAVGGAVIGGLVGGAIGNQRDAAARHNESVNARLDGLGREINTTTINVSNSNGSVTPVVLHRSSHQWVGPRGEVYTNLPTPEQLRPVYGF